MPTLYDADGNEVEVPDNPEDFRNKYEAEIKARKDLEKQLKKMDEELAPIRQTKREETVLTMAKELGFPEQAARAYLRAPDAELTAEQFAAYATEIGYTPQAEGEQKPEAQGRTEWAKPATEGTPVGESRVSRKELDKLWKTNPQRAREVIAAGLVDWKHPEAAEAILSRAR